MKLNKILIFLLLASPFYAKETSFHPYIKGGGAFDDHLLLPSVGVGVLYKVGNHGLDLSGNLASLLIINEVSGKLLYQYSCFAERKYYWGAGIGVAQEAVIFSPTQTGISFEQKFGREWLGEKSRRFVQLELSEKEVMHGHRWILVPTITAGIGF